MAKKRNYYRYELKDGRKTVYVGITNDPQRREIEHRNDGKRFNKLDIVGSAVTQRSAEKWEEERLATYNKNHKGKGPRYNKTKR